MKSISKKYVSTYINSFFWLGMVYFILASIFIIFGDTIGNDKINYSRGLTISAIAMSILAVLYLLRHKKILKENFLDFHNLSEKDNIDYIYYDLIGELSKDDLFLEHRKNLIEFSNLEIENEKTSYIQNPLIILSISFQMAIIVNKITEEEAMSGINLLYIVLVIFIFQFAYYIYYETKKANSNHIEFKRFLLNSDLHEDVKKFDNKTQEPI